MNDNFFIKAAAYGGYDKAETDKQLDFLYKNIKDLKNRLRESELLLKKYEEGNDSAKAHESVLASERASLTNTQMKNKSLSEKCRTAREEADKYKAENEALAGKISKLESELSEAKLKISGETTDIAEILSSTFIEAQKSGAMIIDNAKEKAKLIETESHKFADEFIADVNAKAQQIINDAKAQAEEIRQNALSESEQLKDTSRNLHKLMLEDVESISADMDKIKSALTAFEKNGMSRIEESSNLLSTIREKLAEGGIPVLEVPAKNVEKPAESSEDEEVIKKTDDSEQQSLELARLQALAENLESDDLDFDFPDDKIHDKKTPSFN